MLGKLLAKVGSKAIQKKKSGLKPKPRHKLNEKKYQGSYTPKEQVARKKYKKKHGMFPEDDPRNYPKAAKGAQKDIKKMNLKPQKRAKGGMIVSGVDFVAEQYD